MILDVTFNGKKVGVGDYNKETDKLIVRVNDEEMIQRLNKAMDNFFSIYEPHDTEFDFQLTPLEQMKENNADNE